MSYFENVDWDKLDDRLNATFDRLESRMLERQRSSMPSSRTFHQREPSMPYM